MSVNPFNSWRCSDNDSFSQPDESDEPPVVTATPSNRVPGIIKKRPSVVINEHPENDKNLRVVPGHMKYSEAGVKKHI